MQNDAAAVKASRDALAADADAITAAYITADEKCRSAAAELSSLETALAAQKSTVHDRACLGACAHVARLQSLRDLLIPHPPYSALLNPHSVPRAFRRE